MSRDYPDGFQQAITHVDIEKLRSFLASGLDIRYDLELFQLALDKPGYPYFDPYTDKTLEFKAAKLLIEYGFNIKAFRNILAEQVCGEPVRWAEFEEYKYDDVPDGQTVAFLIQQGAELNYISYLDKTALDLAIEGQNYSGTIIKHPKAEKALREASAKRVSELTHEEFVLAHDLARICLRQDWDDIHYYIQKRFPAVYELSEAMSECCFKYAGSDSQHEPWEQLIAFLIQKGASFRYFVPVHNIHSKFSGLPSCIVLGAKNHTSHAHILRKLKFLLTQGANVNELEWGMTALDAAYQHQNQPAIALLRQYGAKTLAELQAEGRIRGQGHEMQLISDDEVDATP